MLPIYLVFILFILFYIAFCWKFYSVFIGKENIKTVCPGTVSFFLSFTYIKVG